MATSSKLIPPDPSRLPRHVAIIMDGNGRWARKRGLPRVAGHKVGLESVRAAVKACSAWGIGHLTLYAFSSENWRRPKEEVSFLMHLLRLYLRREVKELHENRVRLNAIGRLKDLPEAARKELERCEALTAKNDGLVLTLALNYG
ncbi:MAG: polyprenyl diphosphate synthase, partial [bacterium]